MAKNTSTPKNAKAAEARAKAQAQVRAKERRTTVAISIGAVVVLALFAAVIFFIIQSAQAPELGGEDSPAGSTASGGFPVGTEGVVAQDLPTDAVEVALYEDFMCPICNVFEQTNAEDLDELREAGVIELTYHPISILDRVSQGTRYSTRAVSAAATVADGAPEFYLAFSQALYANQPAEGSAGLTDEQMTQLAIGVGVPEDVANRIGDQEFMAWAGAATEQASIDGANATPTVVVNGVQLDPQQIPYINQPGALRQYIEAVAAE